MTERQEIQLRLACAALQGGMSAEDVYYSLYQDDEQAGLWDIMNEIAPDLFLSIDDRKTLAKDTLQSSTKVVY
jgi:hypothetical protein